MPAPITTIVIKLLFQARILKSEYSPVYSHIIAASSMAVVMLHQALFLPVHIIVGPMIDLSVNVVFTY